jgi:hypothetical protein
MQQVEVDGADRVLGELWYTPSPSAGISTALLSSSWGAVLVRVIAMLLCR